jgi:hypothetical protein
MRLCLALALLLSASAAVAQTGPEQNPPMATVVVPVVGSVVGVNGVQWKTDVELRNDLKTEVTVTMSMPVIAGANVMLFSMAPGATLTFPDVAAMLDVENGLSPLVVQTSGRRSVTIRATAYGTKDGEMFPPQPIAVNYGSTYFTVRVLRGLSFSDNYRTNIGLVNLGSTVAEFTLALQRVPGRNVAVSRIALPPGSLWHLSIQSAFPLITNGDNFSVVVETTSPETHVYASVIENATNSARFVQPGVGGSQSASQ